MLRQTAVRAGDDRRTYALDHPFLLSIAALAAISGAAYLVFPDVLSQSVIGQVLPLGLERVWALAYAVGGIFVIAGFYRLDARPEVLGLMVLAGCYLAYSYAVFAWHGVAPGVVSGSVFIGLSAGCALRAYVLRFEPERAPWRRRTSS